MNNRTPISNSKYLKLIKTSEHFNYFFDEKFLSKEKEFEDIKNILENEYKRFIEIFKFNKEHVFNVYIYEDLKELHMECYGRDDIPDWVTAGGGRGEILGMEGGVATIDPTLKHRFKTYDRMINELAHELVHAFTFVKLPKDLDEKDYLIPIWFYEGLAVYLTDPTLGKDKVINKLKENYYPKLSNFENVSAEKFDENLGYYFSPSIIELIIKDYGKDKILKIIENCNVDVYTTIGVTKEEFESKWHKYLKEKYL